MRALITFIVALLTVVQAHALVPASTGYQTWWDNAYKGAAGGATLDELSSICKAYGDPKWQAAGPPTMQTYPNGGGVYSTCGEWVGSVWTSRGHKPEVKSGLGCPVNSVPGTGGCTCNSGYVENAAKTACELPEDPCKGLKGQYAGNWWKDQGDDNGKPMKVGFSLCDRYNGTGGGQCVVTVGNGPDTVCAQASGGYWQCNGPGYYTGSKAADASKCTVGAAAGSGSSPSDPAPASPPISDNPPKPPATPAPGTAAPSPCPPGQAPGDFNGSRICAPMGGDRPTASGNGSSSTTNNSDGSSTTNTTTGTTTCAQGACNTTTNNNSTTINAPGNSSCPAGQASGSTTVNGQTRTTCTGTSTSTSTQPQATFCKDNPKDKQCGGDGSDTAFGGSCVGGYKAVSDNAVLNAMAEEQYRQNCKMYGDPDSKPQVIPKQTKTATLGTVSVGGWGSSCPAPVPFSANGQTYQISFQPFCDTAPLVRPLVLLACALIAMSIVYAALRGSQ
jgi:hypothetical protein